MNINILPDEIIIIIILNFTTKTSFANFKTTCKKFNIISRDRKFKDFLICENYHTNKNSIKTGYGRYLTKYYKRLIKKIIISDIFHYFIIILLSYFILIYLSLFISIPLIIYFAKNIKSEFFWTNIFNSPKILFYLINDDSVMFV